MPVVADFRNPLTDEDAKQLLTALRKLHCEREVIVARTEKQIAAITAKASETTDQIDARIRELSDQLVGFIDGHRDQFESPRSMRTPDGSFGLERRTRLDIDDPDAALECILDRGYDDCIQIRRTLNKNRISERIAQGEAFDGCILQVGDLAFYRISKALLKEARRNA